MVGDLNRELLQQFTEQKAKASSSDPILQMVAQNYIQSLKLHKIQMLQSIKINQTLKSEVHTSNDWILEQLGKVLPEHDMLTLLPKLKKTSEVVQTVEQLSQKVDKMDAQFQMMLQTQQAQT